MRLIDADDKGNITIVFDNEGRGIIKRIDAPTIQAIPIEVLQEIRQEILVLDDADYDYEGYYKAVTDALAVIDKHIKESDDEWDRVTMIDVDGNTHNVTFKKEIEDR